MFSFCGILQGLAVKFLHSDRLQIYNIFGTILCPVHCTHCAMNIDPGMIVFCIHVSA